MLCWQCALVGALSFSCDLCGGSGDITDRLLAEFQAFLAKPPEDRLITSQELRLVPTAIKFCTGLTAEIRPVEGGQYRVTF